MNEFEALCRVFEELDPGTYEELINEKSQEAIDALYRLTGDRREALETYADFLLCAISADGVLDESEYILAKPFLEGLLGRDLSFGDVLDMFYGADLDSPKGFKKVMDIMVDLIGTEDPQLKDDLILVCLMVCAVDGEVSQKEKDWIEQLIL